MQNIESKVEFCSHFRSRSSERQAQHCRAGLTNKLEKGVFTQLKDKSYFKQVKPFFCGIAWSNEQDLSADTIAHGLKHS
ncbi:MAG: DUF2442 domain-containing protein [Kiritimatiellae bacterium]|nr:DUF2442 domain-containing protein [Kiritimatiellia bacterium]